MILKRTTIAALAALVLVAAFTPAQELAAQETTLTGDWAGILTAPNGMEIEMIFKVVAAEDGALSTTLDVPTQGAVGIACTETTVEGKDLHVSGCEIPGGGGFEGSLNEEGVMAGNFNQAGQSFPMDLKVAAETE